MCSCVGDFQEFPPVKKPCSSAKKKWSEIRVIIGCFFLRCRTIRAAKVVHLHLELAVHLHRLVMWLVMWHFSFPRWPIRVGVVILSDLLLPIFRICSANATIVRCRTDRVAIEYTPMPFVANKAFFVRDADIQVQHLVAVDMAYITLEVLHRSWSGFVYNTVFTLFGRHLELCITTEVSTLTECVPAIPLHHLFPRLDTKCHNFVIYVKLKCMNFWVMAYHMFYEVTMTLPFHNQTLFSLF